MNYNEMIVLIQKIWNININNINDIETKNIHLYFYLFFLNNNKNQNLINIFYLVFKKNFKKMYKNIENELNISFDEYCFLQSIFLYKSLARISIQSEFEDFISSDKILEKHLLYEKKFWIFKLKKIYPFCNQFKKQIFKIYCLLVEDDIIKSKKKNVGIKTFQIWFLPDVFYHIDLFERFNFSYNKFELIDFQNRYFLISDFFCQTVEVFKPNIWSNMRFELKNKDFIKKILDTKLFFDEKNFKNILTKIEDLESVEEKIKNIYIELKNIQEEAEFYQKIIQEQYLNHIIIQIKNDFKNILKIDENAIFKIYILKWIKTELNINKKINIEEIWNEKFKFFEDNKKNKKNHIKNFLKKNKESLKTYIYSINFLNIVNNNEIEIDEYVNKNYRKIIELYKFFKLTQNDINLNFSNNFKEILKLKKKWINLQSQFQKLNSNYNLFLINKNINLFINKNFYFSFFFDFRGRLYFGSIISVTNFKLSRYFFHYGFFTDEEILKLDQCNLPEIHKDETFKYVYDVINHFDLKIYNSNSKKEGIFWCLMAIGKEFIDKTKIFNSTEVIIETGFNKLIKNNNENDLEKWVIIEHYKSIILSYEKKNIEKRFIHKDATASFIQNLIRILGPKNEKSLEYANLKNNDGWYDPYSLAINSWKDTLIINNNNILINEKQINIDNLKYFTRKTCKKPIMTDNYDSTYLTKLNYFKKVIYEEFNEEIDNKSDVVVLFKNFSIYIEKKFWNEYFLENNPNILSEISKENVYEKTIISNKDSNVNLIYKSTTMQKFDTTLKTKNGEKRISKVFILINEEKIDYDSIIQANKANRVHYADALYSRQINNELHIFFLTIHDSFMIDCLSVSKFIIISNRAFKNNLDDICISQNREIFTKIKSIYIFF